MWESESSLQSQQPNQLLTQTNYKIRAVPAFAYVKNSLTSTTLWKCSVNLWRQTEKNGGKKEEKSLLSVQSELLPPTIFTEIYIKKLFFVSWGFKKNWVYIWQIAGTWIPRESKCMQEWNNIFFLHHQHYDQSAEIRAMYLIYSRDLMRGRLLGKEKKRWCKEDAFYASREGWWEGEGHEWNFLFKIYHGGIKRMHLVA